MKAFSCIIFADLDKIKLIQIRHLGILDSTDDKSKLARFVAVTVAVIVIIDAALYGSALASGLSLDDFYFCRAYTLKEVARTFFAPWESLGMFVSYYRPLVILSYAIDHLVWKDNFSGYHFTNLFIHVVVCGILLVFLLRLGFSRAAAALGAIAFTLNANAAAGAAWIAERTDSLCAIFILAALLCFIGFAQTESRRRLIAVYFFYSLALGCKELAVTLVLVLIGLAAFQYPRHLRHAAWIAIMPILYGIARLNIAYGIGTWENLLLFTLAGIIMWLFHSGKWKVLAAVLALITVAAAVLAVYVVTIDKDQNAGGIAVSVGFMLYLQLHKLVRVIVPVDLPLWATALYLIALIGLAFHLIKSYRGYPAIQSWGPLALFALVWIIAFNLPIFHLSQRRMLYLPSAGMSILIAIGIELLRDRVKFKRARVNKVILVGAVIIFFILSIAGNKKQQNKWTTNSSYIISNELILYCKYGDRLVESNLARLAHKLETQGYELDVWCPKIREALNGKPFSAIHEDSLPRVELKNHDK